MFYGVAEIACVYTTKIQKKKETDLRLQSVIVLQKKDNTEGFEPAPNHVVTKKGKKRV